MSISKSTKTHKCPTCGAIESCDIVLVNPDVRHNCRQCGSTWKDGIVISGGGEPK